MTHRPTDSHNHFFVTYFPLKLSHNFRKLYPKIYKNTTVGFGSFTQNKDVCLHAESCAWFFTIDVYDPHK